MVGIALSVKPDMVTLVPEKRRELTTEGGLDLKTEQKKIREAVSRLHEGGIPVSLFINPDVASVGLSAKIRADMVELHTGYYANARGQARQEELEKVQAALELAKSAGLMVNAGHGLDYSNVKPIASLSGLRGLYIGHSIVSRAVLAGMREAVREMKTLIAEAGSSL
jgi:pyridoxine 5-phosphate synthase